eukprot:4143329-Ditylum_brightwellii.AAC.1
MPTMTIAKTAGQAQAVTDNINHPTSKSGKRKLEEQSGVTGNVLINGNQGNIIDKGNTKKNPVLNPTGATSEAVKPGNSVIEENQKKLMPTMTRAKTTGQFQDITDNINHPTSKSGKRKSEEQSGVTGNAQNVGNQGVIINKGNTKKNP